MRNTSSAMLRCFQRMALLTLCTIVGDPRAHEVHSKWVRHLRSAKLQLFV
jgi:hypothetical protein